jgi:hypothetical protein
MIEAKVMNTSSFSGNAAPIRLLAAVLWRATGARPCSYCARKIKGLPYPESDPRLRFCNSKCSVQYRRDRRLN